MVKLKCPCCCKEMIVLDFKEMGLVHFCEPCETFFKIRTPYLLTEIN